MMLGMEPILAYLQRKLREAGSSRWEAIAQAAKVTKSLPRKIAYERENPGVVTIQPLYDYFLAVDAGKKKLPAAANDSKKKARA